MKRFTRKVVSLLFALMLALGLGAPVNAAGTVTYDGNAREFIFEPGSTYSPTDLFDNLKGVMPGDSALQKVTIRNEASRNVKVKIYMRVLGAHEDSEAFLSQLGLTVTQEQDTVLFDAPADRTAQLTGWVCLGTFYSGAEVDLNLQLDVPIELGNEFQDAVGYLDWQFRVEEFPVEPSDPTLPQTGQLNWPVAVLGTAGALLFLFGWLLAGKKKKRDSAQR